LRLDRIFLAGRVLHRHHLGHLRISQALHRQRDFVPAAEHMG
jgi:hypothetical protein